MPHLAATLERYRERCEKGAIMPEEIVVLWNAMHPAYVVGAFMEYVVAFLDKFGVTAHQINVVLSSGSLIAWAVLRWVRGTSRPMDERALRGREAARLS